jgi:hypothetical protein
MLNLNKLEIEEKCERYKRTEKNNNKQFHEIELNPSKDKVMHEGDNSSV